MADRGEPASGGGASAARGRLLAPLALGAVAVVVVIIVTSSVGDDPPAPRESRGNDRTEQAPRQRPSPESYVVEPGDSLSGIAERFGVPVERLQRLNPDVDPQALAAGERLRLRRR